MWLHQTRGCLLTRWERGTDRGRQRRRKSERGSNQSSSQSPWHWRNVMKVHPIIPPTTQEHYLNSNVYQGLNVSRRAPNNTRNGKLIDTISIKSILSSHLSKENATHPLKLCSHLIVNWTDRRDCITLICGYLMSNFFPYFSAISKTK